MAQLHPVSVLLDTQFKLITQEWLFFNINQALLGLQSSSGMPGLCLGLELAEDCRLSAFSQLCCRPPALPNPAPSHMVPTNTGQPGQAAGCVVTLFIRGVCFPDGLHTQTGCSSSQYQPSVLRGAIQCQEQGEPGSCKTVGAEPAPPVRVLLPHCSLSYHLSSPGQLWIFHSHVFSHYVQSTSSRR